MFFGSSSCAAAFTVWTNCCTPVANLMSALFEEGFRRQLLPEYLFSAVFPYEFPPRGTSYLWIFFLCVCLLIFANFLNLLNPVDVVCLVCFCKTVS